MRIKSLSIHVCTYVREFTFKQMFNRKHVSQFAAREKKILKKKEEMPLQDEV